MTSSDSYFSRPDTAGDSSSQPNPADAATLSPDPYPSAATSNAYPSGNSYPSGYDSGSQSGGYGTSTPSSGGYANPYPSSGYADPYPSAGYADPYPSASYPAAYPVAAIPVASYPVSSYSYGPPEHPNSSAVLVLGIVSLFFSILAPVAWIMGSLARRDIREHPELYRESGSLTAGWVIGIIVTCLMILGVLSWFFLFFVLAGATAGA